MYQVNKKWKQKQMKQERKKKKQTVEMISKTQS